MFEFEDLPWFPHFLRNAITDYLSFIIRLGRTYDPVIPLLSAALQRIHETQILDCCSGAGGPWRVLYPLLQRHLPEVHVRLSDYYPNQQAQEFWKINPMAGVEYTSESMNAKDIPSTFKGFRTFFTSFHHFAPNDARQILQDAVDKQTGIGIFEFTHRSIQAFLWMLGIPFLVWIVTPFLRPFSWTRLFFTYLFPIIPFVITWDGVVSCARTYTCRELKQWTDALGTSYEWQVGEVRGPLSPIPVTYLIGLPRQRLKGEAA